MRFGTLPFSYRRALRSWLGAAAIAALCAAPAGVSARATVKEDGKWRFALGAGASFASGNSDASSAHLKADGVRATGASKTSLYGRLLHGRSDGDTTADQLVIGGRYDHDLNARWFGYGQVELLRDRPANLSSRASLGGGVGYHFVRSETTRWDLFAGLGYTVDRYREDTTVAGELRSSYSYAELFLGEESTHAVSETTSFKQRLAIWPNLRDSGEFRAEFDAGVAVAINKTLSLTAGLQYRYNSDPGTGLEKGDTLFVTGLSLSMD